MPSLARLLCAAGALLVALLAFGTAATTAQTPEPVTITVKPPNDGRTATIALADVTPDINTTYTVAKSGGGTERIKVTGGVSVRQILDATDTNFQYSVVEIQRPGGETLTLTKAQVDDIRPPVFYTDAQGVTRFIGPAGAKGVVAAEDHFEVQGAVELSQQSRSRLSGMVSPREKKIKVGGSVTFTFEVEGTRPQETLVYRWRIKGGKATTTERKTHKQTFPKKDGVYKLLVSANVKGDAENSAADVATITVGNPKKSDKDRDGGGDNTTGTSDSGPSTGGGGAGDVYGGGSSGYAPEPYTPVVPSTPSTPPPADDLQLDTPTDDFPASGTTVEGNLLADATDPPPASLLDSAAKAARDGTPSDDAQGASVPEAAISIAGVLALLGLGAGLEFRQGKLPRVRTPKLPLPRRGA